jgi:hypothetical protein
MVEASPANMLEAMSSLVAGSSLSQTLAAVAIDPERPPGPHALVRWHDRVGGPRDFYGRRIWTPEICDAIRVARERSREARAGA